nr:hypothetical protein [Nocardia transvalensis]
MLGVDSVVQHDQSLTTRELCPPQRGPSVDAVGDLLARNAHRPQQRIQRRAWLQRFSIGRVAVQVYEDLEVGISLFELVRGMQCKSGLPDASHPVDRDGEERPVGGPVVCRDRGEQSSHLLVTAGEIGDIGRKGVPAALRTGPGAAIESGVVAQNLFVHPTQLWAGVYTQLIFQEPPGILEYRQRLCPPTTAVEREHQHRAQPLPQRMRGHQMNELGDCVIGQATIHHDRRPLLQSGKAPFLQPSPLGGDHRTLQPAEGFTAPQRQRRIDVLHGLVEPASPITLVSVGQVPFERYEVQLCGIASQRVAGLRPHQRGDRVRILRHGAEAERFAQTADVALHGIPRLVRRVLTPYGSDDSADGHRPVHLQQEDNQHGLLPRRPQIEVSPVPARRHRAENAVPYLPHGNPSPGSRRLPAPSLTTSPTSTAASSQGQQFTPEGLSRR